MVKAVPEPGAERRERVEHFLGAVGFTGLYFKSFYSDIWFFTSEEYSIPMKLFKSCGTWNVTQT